MWCRLFKMDKLMPLLIDHIDAIAREKKRDVLFVHFENYVEDKDLEDNARETLMAWLDENGIAYTPCMGLEDNEVINSYLGDLYIDLPFDENNPSYQILSNHLEDEEGNMKIEDVYFYVLSLEIALEIEAERKSEQTFNDQDNAPFDAGRLC